MKIMNTITKNGENMTSTNTYQYMNPTEKKSKKDNQIGNDIFYKPTLDKLDKLITDKQAKFELDTMNDLLYNNYMSNNASSGLANFYEKGGFNPDYYLNANNNTNQQQQSSSMPLESNFFTSFQNVMNNNQGQGQMQPHSQVHTQVVQGQNNNNMANPAANNNPNDMLNQNGFYPTNPNNFLLSNNINPYEDFVKTQPGSDFWYGAANQYSFPEKSFLNQNLFCDNGSTLLDNPFFIPAIEDMNVIKQGQDLNLSNNAKLNLSNLQQQFPNSTAFGNMNPLGNINNFNGLSNPLMLNSIPPQYGGNDMSMGNFLIPSIPNLNIEDLYNMNFNMNNPGIQQGNPTSTISELKLENSMKNLIPGKSSMNMPDMQDHHTNGIIKQNNNVSNNHSNNMGNNNNNPSQLQDKSNMLNGMQIPSKMQGLLMGDDIIDPQSNLLKYFPYFMGSGFNNNNSNLDAKDFFSMASNTTTANNTNNNANGDIPLVKSNMTMHQRQKSANQQYHQQQPQQQQNYLSSNLYSTEVSKHGLLPGNKNSGLMGSNSHGQNGSMPNGNMAQPSSLLNTTTINASVTNPTQQQQHSTTLQGNLINDYSKFFGLNYLSGMQNSMNQNLFGGADMEFLSRGLVDSLLAGNNTNNNSNVMMKCIGSSNNDPFMKELFKMEDNFAMSGASAQEIYNKLREKSRYERSLKIEKYKNKKRNWKKKIAYDCRKRVADTRLRIKGRFISKKERIFIQVFYL